VIWHGARADDPYADWWLIKVDQALSLAGATLDDAKTALEERLATAEGMDVDTAASVKPTRVRLQFANPYAYRGAQLLASYDGFARRVLSAQYVGLLTRDETERCLH
jgi:integrating conjugative element protein (TIGR03761 family)